MRWKDKTSRFWIFLAGRPLRLAGGRRLPEGRAQRAESKHGGWVYILAASRDLECKSLPKRLLNSVIIISSMVALIAEQKEEDRFMSEQTKDETKSVKTAATSGQSEAVEKIEKGASDLAEDELSKISAGAPKLHNDSY